MLYELLTGRPPFRAATLLETLEQVRTTEAVPPSKLQPGLPRDLETIALKCLEKEPARRYATALDLAEDLRRYLAGETIRAKPVGPIERAVKWARRRPFEAGFLGVTAVALLSLTWALAASTYEQNLKKKNRALDAALADAEQQRARAKRSFDQARDVVDHFIALIERRLDEPNLKSARDALLADGLAYYQKMLAQWDDTPELQFELIRTYTGAAKVADSLGSKPEALKAYQQALHMLDRLVTRCPGVPDYRLELAEVHHSLGRFYADTGQIDQALRSYEAGRAIREQLRRDTPSDPRVLTDLARSHGYIGDLLLAAGRLDDAERAYLQSHEIRKNLARFTPGDPVLHFQLARSFTNLARLNRENGSLGEALEAYRQAIALIEPLDAERPELREFRGDLAWTSNQLGMLLLEAAPPRADEALVILERGRALHEALIKAHPGVPDYRSGLGESLLGCGLALAAEGKSAEALRSCQQARTVYDQLVSEDSHVMQYRSGLAMSCDAAADLLLQSGEADEARKACARGRTILEQLVQDDPGNLEYRSDLGQVLADDARCCHLGPDTTQVLDTLHQAIAQQRAVVARSPKVALYQRRLEAELAELARMTKTP
jgi:tetratricopeptide (TPR) repeat protein